MSVIAVIPARIGSERLSRKPLQLLAGRPLIEWVWKRVVQFKSADHVCVATDSDEVAGICYAFGADVELTSADHKSGTERVAEVAARHPEFDVVVNVQGDEPFVAEEHVTESVRMVRAGFDVGTVGIPIGSLEDWYNPAAVKIAMGSNNRALYFSRAPIPHQRDGNPSAADLVSDQYLRHIGVYAYSSAALARWVALPPVSLENSEKLEQLRPLSAGMTFGVAVVSELSVGVDTAEDLAEAERRLLKTMEK
ncbi:MAG TPA: 3-deoxy-manno-octulosonate cytidylyltransferase [Longimicrobiales bacterium]|nr:3-deoxy-manno-octulosonate cytidylyltransferase [Longimicrobiales bacterium]